MANSDKNILITPNRNLSGLPEIAFTGFGNSSISLKVPDSSTGTINFETGGASIFSIDTNLSSGTIFSASGNTTIPYLTVNSDGSVVLTPNGGCVSVDGNGLQLPGYESSALPQGGPEGLLVYDNTERVPKIYDGTRWTSLGRSIVKNGLVFWVDASRRDSYATFPTGSTSLVDVAGGFTGTLTNGPSYNSSQGGSIVFDGANDLVVYNTNNNLAINAITVSCWIYSTALVLSTGRTRGCAVGGPGGMYLGLISSVDGGVTSAIHWGVQSTSGRPTVWTGNVPVNVWVHLTGVYNGSESIAYYNGIYLASAGSQTGPINRGTQYWVGTYAGLTDGNHNFAGRIGEVQIYNRALTQGEIWRNFNATRGRYGL